MAVTVAAPEHDDDIPAFVSALGMPGLVDIHTHFMPARMLRKVWQWFDDVGWQIHYREAEPQRLARLRAMQVRAFTALSYPHKPGMAQWLNGWAAAFSEAHADCVPSATFFPEPGADGYVAEALESGVRVFKVHLQVGGYDPRDPLLRPVWRRLAAAGVPVVTHAGSGPLPGPYTGPGPIGEVLQRHPSLVAVIAHMGGHEYEEFLALALRYPNVHLDCTMTFTDYMERARRYPRELLGVLADNADRVVLGTDFPNIPHPYAHQLQVLADLGLGDPWLRAVCHDNGARLLRLDPVRSLP